MKIAMMVRSYLPVPRPADMIYAPIDLAVAIAEGLTQQGHEVDLFAPLGSSLRHAKIESSNLRPLARNQEEMQKLLRNSEEVNHYIPALWDNYMVDEMFERAVAGEYDLLHFHHPEVALQAARANPNIPVAYTLHDPVYNWYKEVFELYGSPNQHFISISENQRRDAPDLPYAGTVYNGIDPNEFTYSADAEDYLMITGRIVPEKGFKEAIQVAQQTGMRLFIIGPVYPDHQGYFDQYIKPHLNDKILYLGYMEREHLVKYYQKAKALLMPIQWEEPFGLTMIEAMACGTPVVALRRGSVPEVLKHGKTGFVVNSLGDMAEALKKIDTIDRATCRAHVELNFSNDHMVQSYKEVYEKILRAPQRKRFTRNYVRTQLRRLPIKQLTGGLAKVPKVVPKDKKSKDKNNKPGQQLDLL
jgi:glycosyltransferase involved in cell wall biosynthesis